MAVDCGIVCCMCYVDLSYLLYVYWLQTVVLSVVCVMLTLVIYCMCIGVLAADCGIVRCMCYVDLSYLLYVYWCIGCRLWYCPLYVLC